MTNFDIIRSVKDEDVDEMIIELSRHMAKICAREVKRLCIEYEIPGVEIRNFDLADIELAYRTFFRDSNKKKEMQ